MLIKLLQSEKLYSPMFATLSGIVTLIKLLQPENALLPILVTLFGIVGAVVRDVQP